MRDAYIFYAMVCDAINVFHILIMFDLDGLHSIVVHWKCVICM